MLNPWASALRVRSFRLRLQVECNIAFDLGVYETVDGEPDQGGPAVTALPLPPCEVPLVYTRDCSHGVVVSYAPARDPALSEGVVGRS